MDCSTLGLSVPHHLLQFAQVHVYWISDIIQPSHHVWPPPLAVLNICYHQDLCQWVSSSHQVAKVLEFQLQLQCQYFQWVFSVDFLYDSVQLLSHVWLFCNSMDCRTPGLPVLHHLLEFSQTHVDWIGGAIQPSGPLLSLLLLPSVFPSVRVLILE